MLTACLRRWIFLSCRAQFSQSAKLAKSYYDTLGVTPNATQNDIKTAYYKLSMIYHPDKNKGSEEEFRDITEAYEVLGNFRLKKLYDKGLLHKGGSQFSKNDTNSPDDNQTKFYKSRMTRDKPPSTGKTPIYNFDEWSHAHYGAAFARRAAAKEKLDQMKAKNLRNEKELESELVMVGFLLTLLCFYGFTYVAKQSNDIVNEGLTESKD